MFAALPCDQRGRMLLAHFVQCLLKASSRFAKSQYVHLLAPLSAPTPSAQKLTLYGSYSAHIEGRVV